MRIDPVFNFYRLYRHSPPGIMAKIQIEYDKHLYSNLFYHVSNFAKLLSGNLCTRCKADCSFRKGVTHHCAYMLPNEVMVLTCEFEMIGLLLFPVCNSCHKYLHLRANWYVAPMNDSLKHSHNHLHIFRELQHNWNSLCVHGHYKKNESEWIWQAYF